MPKFFYSIIVMLVLLWGSIVLVVFRVPPLNYFRIFLFIFQLFLAFSLTFSIPIYLIQHKKKPEFVDLRVLYRKSLKWGWFFSFGICAFLLLNALDLLNILWILLFLVLYSGLFIYLKRKR